MILVSGKKSIVKKIILRIIALSLFILLGVSTVAGYVFYRSALDIYSQMAYSFSETACIEITDSELTEQLINNPELAKALLNFSADSDYKPDDKDAEIMQFWSRINIVFFQAVNNNRNLSRFQVVVPDETGVTTLWYEDEETPAGSKPFHRGYHEGEKEAIEQLSKSDVLSLFDSLGEEKTPDLDIHWDNGIAIGTALYPIWNNVGDKVIAYCEVEVSISGVQKTIILLTLFVSGIIVIIMVIGILFYFKRMKKEIINPVVQLQKASLDAVERIRAGNPVSSLDIHTHDELETLAHNFEDMEKSLYSYVKENAEITSEQEHIATQLSMAATIQSDMLINQFPAFPERKDLDIYASMVPAKIVGGDFYDFFFVDDDTIALVIADVSGKGVPASLFMMRSMLLIENFAKNESSPAEILREVNQQLCANNKGKMFVTVWLGLLNLKTGRLVASNAGHEYPIIKAPGKSYELYKDSHGFVLGGMKKLNPKEYELMLEPGTRLLLYTDGATEAKNSDNQMIRTEGFMDMVNQSSDDTPIDLLRDVGTKIQRFIGEAEQFDDLTLMSIFYYGPESSR